MNMKKLFLLNLPYLLFVYPFDKLAQAFRLAPGSDLSGKLLSIGDGFTATLSSPWLSFHPTDLLIGIAGAVVLRMAVYLKGKNAKKYRHGIEYGSARWGTAADIAPYMDKDFFQNIPMTQTERITMASRPKQPKYHFKRE
jgi:type IV secretion system protein VirD4